MRYMCSNVCFSIFSFITLKTAIVTREGEEWLYIRSQKVMWVKGYVNNKYLGSGGVFWCGDFFPTAPLLLGPTAHPEQQKGLFTTLSVVPYLLSTSDSALASSPPIS